MRQFHILLFSVAVHFFCPAQSTSFISQIKKLPEQVRRDYIINQVKDLYKKDSIKAQREIGDALIFFKGKNTIYATLLGEQSKISVKIKNYLKALEYEQKALEVYEQLNDFDSEITSITKLTRLYRELNRVNEAMDLLFKKLKSVEGNPEHECVLLERIGVAFKEMKNEDKGLIYLQQADEKSKLVTTPSTEFNQTLLSIYKNIGVLYRNKKDLDKALYYFDKGYALAESVENVKYKGIILNSLGILFKQKGEYLKAIKAFEASVKFKQEDDNNAGISNSLTNIGLLYFEINNFKKAEEYLLHSYQLAIRTRDKKTILESCTSLFKIYDGTNKPAIAYSYLKRAFFLKDSLYTDNISEESAKLEAIYNTEKKQKEIEINKIRNQQLEKNIESKNRERNILLFGALILIVFLIWAIWSFIGKKRANSMLEEKNDLINKQKLLVEEKQKEILDSIHYAKKIQNALLTSENYIQKSLNKLQKK
jgi:tetratricopeptide (TPR) repeat protein